MRQSAFVCAAAWSDSKICLLVACLISSLGYTSYNYLAGHRGLLCFEQRFGNADGFHCVGGVKIGADLFCVIFGQNRAAYDDFGFRSLRAQQTNRLLHGGHGRGHQRAGCPQRQRLLQWFRAARRGRGQARQSRSFPAGRARCFSQYRVYRRLRSPAALFGRCRCASAWRLSPLQTQRKPLPRSLGVPADRRFFAQIRVRPRQAPE